MEELTARQFGLLIAYVLPGFLLLCGLGVVTPGLRVWLLGPDGSGPTAGSIPYVLVASVGAGMTASVVRWALVDALHHLTGLRRPAWNDARLETRLPAYQFLVEIHYRYYQFYGNTLVAAVPSYALWRLAGEAGGPLTDVLFVLLSLVYLAGSRDALRRYYARTERLLGQSRRSVSHDQRRQARNQALPPPPRTRQAQALGGDPVGVGNHQASHQVLRLGTTTPDSV